jgi:hypothetical protein
MCREGGCTETRAHCPMCQWRDARHCTQHIRDGTCRTCPRRATRHLFGSQQLNDSGVAADDARFLFDKGEGSFRAGEAQGTEWDTRGAHSVGFGLNCTTAGAASVALGTGSSAAGDDSFAGGAGSTVGATEDNAFVWSDSTARTASAADEVTFGAAGNFRILGGNLIQEAFGHLQGERAAVPAAPGAGNGYWWIRNDSPNVPMYTDDAGTDFVLNAGTAGSGAFNNIAGVTKSDAGGSLARPKK